MQEVQVTSGVYGHMLNGTQVFSPDDEWVVYDTRNDQTHISRTCCIEKVNINTGEIVKLYSAPEQTLFGPGVGAAAWHPRQNRIIFIHGLLNCDETNPYGFTRRFGAILDESAPGRISAAEARTIDTPLIPGALRGGTHAHSWSGDGEWISFTYNDFLIERLAQNPGNSLRDLRTIGVMSPVQTVTVNDESAENFSGQYFTTVAATVTDNPKPGSDEIDKAFDECWIGANGYIRKDGSRQRRAIAFQGQIRTADDTLLTEVFVSDIPDDITTPGPDGPLEGSQSSRPLVPAGLSQRRVTFTENRKYPGLQGPRFWMRASPDGALLYFLLLDDNGHSQIHEVSVHGGEIRKVTDLPGGVQAQFNINPDGESIAVIADNSIWTCHIRSGSATRRTPSASDDFAPVLAVVWNHKGDRVVYNRYVQGAGGPYLQIFQLKLN